MKAVSKVIEKEKEVKQMEFPCLMQCETEGIVVLFTSLHEGTVLVGNDDYGVGYTYDDWGDACHYPWKQFEGKIIIGNE